MRSWYHHVNAELSGDNSRLAAFAVLSPQLTVSQNVRALLELEATGSTSLGFPKNIAKAKGLLNGHLAISEGVRGPKVEGFYRSLCLVPGAICIDRHMLAWSGCNASWSKRNVDHAKKMVREYAKLHGIATFEAQAEIWAGLVKGSSRETPKELFCRARALI